MCGRYTFTGDIDDYAGYFGAVAVSESLAPSYNVAPTDAVYAVVIHDDERRIGTMRWGLVPWWAKDRTIAARHINARMETAHEKPAFRDSFRERRCLIPADGFFEWERRGDRGKLPHYIHRASGEPLALAGLWDRWRAEPGADPLVTCSILTGDPSELVARLHNRMPVMLPEHTWDAWLDPTNREPGDIRRVLTSAGAVSDLAEYPVSTLVNSVRNNVPECIAPLPPSPRDSMLPFGQDGDDGSEQRPTGAEDESLGEGPPRRK